MHRSNALSWRLVPLLAALPLIACKEEPMKALATERSALETRAAASGLAEQLLSLAVRRDDLQPPTIEQARLSLSACDFRQATKGECRHAGNIFGAVLERGTELILTLSAAKGTGTDPLAGAAAIRSEVICPELTLMASQSARAFRVTAPGTRDFAMVSLEEESQQRTILVYAAEPIDCALLQRSLSLRASLAPKRD